MVNIFAFHRELDEPKVKAPPRLSKRAATFDRWDRIGVELVRADLKRGGRSIVGTTVAARALAEEWLKLKDAERAQRAAQAQQEKGAIAQLMEWTNKIGHMTSRH